MGDIHGQRKQEQQLLEKLEQDPDNMGLLQQLQDLHSELVFQLEPETEPEPELEQLVSREAAAERAAERRNPIDYSWSQQIRGRPASRIRHELVAAHRLGDEAASRLYQRLALAAVLSDRVGEHSCLWELPGTGDLHIRIVTYFEATRVADATLRRYRSQGWAWHAAWLRQEKVAHLYRSVTRAGEMWAPGAGAERVHSLEAEREARSLLVCLQNIAESNPPETAHAALSTMAAVLQRVLDEPDNPRVRRLRRGNASLQRELLSATGGEALLVATGFERCTDPPRRSRRSGSSGTQPEEEAGQRGSGAAESWFVLDAAVAVPYVSISLEAVQTQIELATETPLELEPEPETQTETQIEVVEEGAPPEAGAT